MGWRDRDWAKFDNDEFASIYGRAAGTPNSSTTRRGATPRLSPQRHRRSRFRIPRFIQLFLISVAGAALLFGWALATGRVSSSAQSFWAVPSVLPIQVPAAPQPGATPAPTPRVMRIAGTRILQRGAAFTLSGRHTPQAGSIAIMGRWGSGSWETVAVANGLRSTYFLRIPLTRRGVLYLKIRYPDGSTAVGTYRVE